jgi:hypothetical protein
MQSILDIIRDIEPWFSDGLEVHKSSVHREGLYANRGFCGGSDIMRLGGCLFHVDERRSVHVMPSTTTPISEKVLLAEPSVGSRDYSDYLNHSCDPNIGFRDAISIVAIRDIRCGEELMIDYAFWECDPTWQLKNICNCGAQCCRKHVTGEDWKAIKPTDKLFKYFSPFLKRRICALSAKGKTNETK